jgi:hypothetical protein
MIGKSSTHISLNVFPGMSVFLEERMSALFLEQRMTGKGSAH